MRSRFEAIWDLDGILLGLCRGGSVVLFETSSFKEILFCELFLALSFMNIGVSVSRNLSTLLTCLITFMFRAETGVGGFSFETGANYLISFTVRYLCVGVLITFCFSLIFYSEVSCPKRWTFFCRNYFFGTPIPPFKGVISGSFFLGSTIFFSEFLSSRNFVFCLGAIERFLRLGSSLRSVS